MKLVKHLLLGSAAGLVAVTGAQAADLPLAEPVEYVKVCDTYGRGYFYIPGTQTCLQISGYVRADARMETAQNRTQDEFYYRTRARLQFDARTQTEYGTLRAYIRLQSDFSNENQNSKPLAGGANGSETYAEKAFVQFAGFTVGLSQSFFDMLNYTTFQSVFSDKTAQLAAYTATFGSGMSFTLSAEDRSYREAPGDFVYAGTEMPDVVAAFRVDQGWGSFQLSGAVHQLRVGLPASTYKDTDYGFAVQAGVNFKLPMLGKGDTLWFNGVYADGALQYLGDNTSPWSSGGGAINKVDGNVNLAANGIDTSTGFAVGLGLQHFWTPTVRSSLSTVYTDVENGGPAGEDYAQIFAAANVVWSPVKDLDVGLEVFYANLTDTPAVFVGNEDRWGGIVRVQRNF
jgi:hypothetical protein